jgi:hypothetical protein
MIKSDNELQNSGLDLNQNGTPTINRTVKTIAMLTASRMPESRLQVQRTAIGIPETTPFKKAKLIMKPKIARILPPIERILLAVHFPV